MVQFIILLFVIAAVVVAFLHLQQEGAAGLPRIPALVRRMPRTRARPDDDPYYADLSTAMFKSLGNPRFARATDGAIVVNSSSYVAIASPRDAQIIHNARVHFTDDVNGLIKSHRHNLKLRVTSQIQIVHVIRDEEVADGEPILMTAATARSRQLQRREDSAIRGAREEYGSDALGYQGAPADWSGAASAAVRGGAATRVNAASITTGVLIPDTAGLNEISVTALGQRLGRNPGHGNGAIAISSVSWDHADITPTAYGLELRDLESRHGTQVNGQVVEAHLLADGDVVNFGEDAQFTWVARGAAYTPTGE